MFVQLLCLQPAQQAATSIARLLLLLGVVVFSVVVMGLMPHKHSRTMHCPWRGITTADVGGREALVCLCWLPVVVGGLVIGVVP